MGRVVQAFTLLCLAAVSAAQLPKEQPAASPPVPPAQQITERQRAVTDELQTVAARIADAGESISETLAGEQDMLERISLLLEQQAVTLRQAEESEDTLTQLRSELTRVRVSGPTEPSPYSLLMLDSVRDELHTLRGRVQTVAAAVAAATDAREQARATFDQRETARRQAREALETGSAENQPALTRQLRTRELESRLAEADLQLRKLERDRQERMLEIVDTRIQLAEERERWIAEDTTFASEDLQARIVELEAREERVRKDLDLQRSQIEFAEQAWFDSRARLDAAPEDAALVEEVAARRLAFQVQQRKASTLTKRVERLAGMKAIWRNRFLLRRGTSESADIATWEADARATLEGLDTESRLQELEQRDLATERVTLQARLDAAAESTGTGTHWIRQQLALNTELGDVYADNMASIEAARRLAERVLDDIGRDQASLRWPERLGDLGRSIGAVWDFEITTVDDRSITVGKIVVGIVLLILGFFLSKLISGWFGRRLLPRLGMNEGAAAALRSVLFYLLLVGFVFFSLRTINVPLTAFTILGGAIAIGVGFGSQNIMNNFMSGLILLAERPIRVGDLIQIGELYGIIQHIGARSTRVVTGDNVEIVVPNSSFLENNVINWTLSESKVRIHVNVGVVYGSPTREVNRLLQKAVEEHGRVLKSPSPIVLFTEFGDNSLNFEVHFWIMMRRIMDRKMIESDIRHRIDHLFNEAKIVIAFPQRDVHLDTARPLEVQVVAPDAEEPGA